MISFEVVGKPVPQGSMKAYTNKRTGKTMLTSTSGARLKDWRQLISLEAAKHTRELIDGPVEISVVFTMLRPKSVKRKHPSVAPDLDKLLRSLGDSLTNVVIRDDALIVKATVTKRYTEGNEQPGVSVMLWEME